MLQKPNYPADTPFEEWLRALPGAVFGMAPSVIPPIDMIRSDLEHTYSPSIPTVTVFVDLSGVRNVVGFLQAQAGRFEGELSLPGGCWTHLSLKQSVDGFSLVGNAKVNRKIAHRRLRTLTKGGAKRRAVSIRFDEVKVKREISLLSALQSGEVRPASRSSRCTSPSPSPCATRVDGSTS